MLRLLEPRPVGRNVVEELEVCCLMYLEGFSMSHRHSATPLLGDSPSYTRARMVI